MGAGAAGSLTGAAELFRFWVFPDCTFLDISIVQEFALEANPQKTVSGKLKEGVPFLGYVFYDNKISIRPAAKQKIESSLEELFRKRKNQVIPQALFIWRLNLRISGCILESKKYGWLFYYSQMSDLTILFQLDWLIQRLFKRFKIDQPDSIKSFVRTYHEITKNVSHSTYLINADLYSCGVVHCKCSRKSPKNLLN